MQANIRKVFSTWINVFVHVLNPNKVRSFKRHANLIVFCAQKSTFTAILEFYFVA